MITVPAVNNLLRLWSLRGQQIVNQLQTILSLGASSPADLSPVLGPAVLFELSFAQAQKTVVTFVMTDESFSGFTLEMQDQIARQAVAWAELFATAGNVAFYDGFPGIGTLLTTTPSAQLFSAQARAISVQIDTRLESYLSVPTLAGLTTKTFWSATDEAVQALSRLLSIDWVLSSDPTVYYGPVGTVANILDDALLVLERIGPLVPSVDAVLTQVNAAIASGYTDAQAVSITSIIIPQDTNLLQLAERIYGDPDQFQVLVNFNNLVFPFISTDPIERLGTPKQTGLSMVGGDVLKGATSIQVTGLGVFANDDRLLIQTDDHRQVLTITGGAFTSTTNPVDWNNLPPADYDLENKVYTLTFTPPLDRGYVFDCSSVTLYPAVYDTGTVLTTGDILLAPISLAASGTAVVDTTHTDLQRLGTDAALDDYGFLSITNGDLTTVTGLPNLKQALLDRFKVEKGTLIRHPDYGTLVPTYIGRVIRPALAFALTVDATQTVLGDPRVDSVSGTQATEVGDAINLEFNVAQSNGRLLFPSNLSLTVPSTGLLVAAA